MITTTDILDQNRDEIATPAPVAGPTALLNPSVEPTPMEPMTDSAPPDTAPANPATNAHAISPLRLLFSSPEEFQGAATAEALTKLKAREVFRPASDTECGRMLFPFDPKMRCQLGEVTEPANLELPAIPGMRYAVNAKVTYFSIVASGPTWGEAIAAWRRLRR